MQQSHPSYYPQQTAPHYSQQTVPQQNIHPPQNHTPPPVGTPQYAVQQPYYPRHDEPVYQYGDLVGYASPPQEAGVPPSPSTGVSSWFEFSNSGYLKGFILGAGVTFLVANPAIQKALITGAVKLWSLIQGGVEEIKEQAQDVKAEMETSRK